jgi:hypothetical protein
MTKADALATALTGIQRLFDEHLEIAHRRNDPETLEAVERNLNFLHDARRVIKKMLCEELTKEIEGKKQQEQSETELKN